MSKSYKDQLFDDISRCIEDVGSQDEQYNNEDKARDILEVLEALLAYTIYTTCISKDTVRDSCEESYFNIKRQALVLMDKELQATKE
ncbi:Uncharacterised protein [Legionella busanensis]|uniref:Uncharacterized protein n=1 Tax=Legionella busanensis TaxID=190655 RepID=A0A378JLM2_9GAMM|nr:hypothetical protein [Legionella busanensis]STX51588.1 Uncharacterised protein [Legionella busanensis]